MKKEYRWVVPVDGVEHTVECVISGNRYILFADGDFWEEIYRQSFPSLQGGIDRVVHLYGKDLHFVVWEEIPDLEVDGILQEAQVSYADRKCLRQRTARRIGSTQMILGGAYLLFAILRYFLAEGHPAPVPMLLLALYLYLWGFFRVRFAKKSA